MNDQVGSKKQEERETGITMIVVGLLGAFVIFLALASCLCGWSARDVYEDVVVEFWR